MFVILVLIIYKAFVFFFTFWDDVRCILNRLPKKTILIVNDVTIITMQGN